MEEEAERKKCRRLGSAQYETAGRVIKAADDTVLCRFATRRKYRRA